MIGHEAEAPHSLHDLPAGKRGIIYALTGGYNLRSRAANLGFTTGVEVLMRQNYGRGPVLVSVRGTLVALGRAEAARILVKIVDQPCPVLP